MTRFPVGYPAAVEREYLATLNRRVAETRRLVEAALAPVLKELEARERAREEEAARSDADDDQAARARAALSRIREEIARRLTPDPDALRRTGLGVDRVASTRVRDLVSTAIKGARPELGETARVAFLPGEGTGQVLAGWVRENVSLITSIDDRYFADLERLFAGGIESGQNTAALRKVLEERYGVSRSRAQLIARDQIAKLNGQIAEKRQSDLGIEEYAWRTVGDERVRETHAEKDGRRFRWDDPPADTGHPGTDYQCRCVAEPVLPRGGASAVGEILARRR